MGNGKMEAGGVAVNVNCKVTKVVSNCITTTHDKTNRFDLMRWMEWA